MIEHDSAVADEKQRKEEFECLMKLGNKIISEVRWEADTALTS